MAPGGGERRGGYRVHPAAGPSWRLTSISWKRWWWWRLRRQTSTASCADLPITHRDALFELVGDSEASPWL